MVSLRALLIEFVFFYPDELHEFTVRLVDDCGYRFVA